MTSSAEEAEVELFYEDLQDLLELTPREDVHHRGPECKSHKTPGVTGKFGLGVQNEAEQRLKKFCLENALVISKHSLPATQEKILHMDITRWSILKSD